MPTMPTDSEFITIAKYALYQHLDAGYMLTAFLSGVICTALSIVCYLWLPWAPLAVFPLVIFTVYYTLHQPYEYYKQLRAEFRPIVKRTENNITFIWVPTRADPTKCTKYYVVHYDDGEVCRVTTEDPLEYLSR